jgi:hypothetical protein
MVDGERAGGEDCHVRTAAAVAVEVAGDRERRWGDGRCQTEKSTCFIHAHILTYVHTPRNLEKSAAAR